MIERTDMGVKGRDRNGQLFAIHFYQVSTVEKKPYGSAVRLDTGELIPLSMGYERAKLLFNKHS